MPLHHVPPFKRSRTGQSGFRSSSRHPKMGQSSATSTANGGRHATHLSQSQSFSAIDHLPLLLKVVASTSLHAPLYGQWHGFMPAKQLEDQCIFSVKSRCPSKLCSCRLTRSRKCSHAEPPIYSARGFLRKMSRSYARNCEVSSTGLRGRI